MCCGSAHPPAGLLKRRSESFRPERSHDERHSRLFDGWRKGFPSVRRDHTTMRLFCPTEQTISLIGKPLILQQPATVHGVVFDFLFAACRRS
jgi:hypothetical protein